MSERFRVMLVRDAVAAGYLDEWYMKWSEWDGALLDFKDPEKPVLIATDGGQPEDNNFYRDWAWVPKLLNELAEGKNETI